LPGLIAQTSPDEQRQATQSLAESHGNY
jgi:hypothetical protein